MCKQSWQDFYVLLHCHCCKRDTMVIPFYWAHTSPHANPFHSILVGIAFLQVRSLKREAVRSSRRSAEKGSVAGSTCPASKSTIGLRKFIKSKVLSRLWTAGIKPTSTFRDRPWRSHFTSMFDTHVGEEEEAFWFLLGLLNPHHAILGYAIMKL